MVLISIVYKIIMTIGIFYILGLLGIYAPIENLKREESSIFLKLWSCFYMGLAIFVTFGTLYQLWTSK